MTHNSCEGWHGESPFERRFRLRLKRVVLKVEAQWQATIWARMTAPTDKNSVEGGYVMETLHTGKDASYGRQEGRES